MFKESVPDNSNSLESSLEEKTKRRANELKAHASEKASLKSKDPEKSLPSSVDQDAIEEAIVDELNMKLAIVHTSSTYILIEKSETEFVLDSKTSLLNLYENQIVPELSSAKSKRLLTKAHIWLKSAQRRTYDKIVFNPRIAGHYDGNYNIWKGFAIRPSQGDCSLFWEHVENNICRGRKNVYKYVRKWLAHLIQKPHIIGTALVLRGKQGTGKGVFVQAIGKLLGQHFAHLSNFDQILGRFNSHLKNAILIYADEALWGGNKREIGALKALITEPTLFIEGKGKDGYWVDNIKHLIVSSNEAWAVHLDPDDRRFFILDVSDAKKENHEYFQKIQCQLDNGGYEALVHDLLHENLEGFDPRKMPDNFDGFDLKLESASSIDRFLHKSLKNGCWDHALASSSDWDQSPTIEKLYGLYRAYCEWEKQTLLKSPVFGKRLKAIFPLLSVKRSSGQGGQKRSNMYLFPPFEECRSDFERFYKQNSKIWELS